MVGDSRIFFLVPFVVLLSICPVLSGAAEPEHVIFPEQEAVLDPAAIPALEREAMGGSIDAAHRLATYYETIKLDNKRGIFWTQIRVENGDRNARYDLGAYLAVDEDPLNKSRARYWLKQVESDGNPELVDLVKSVLRDMDDRERYEKSIKH
jgi:TPR repeat protein